MEANMLYYYERNMIKNFNSFLILNRVKLLFKKYIFFRTKQIFKYLTNYCFILNKELKPEQLKLIF